MQAAKIAPPAGPDSTSRTGRRIAVSVVVIPPHENISSKGQRKPAHTNSYSSFAIYRPIKGWRYAFVQAVEKRSYSRISGDTSQDSVTATLGKRRAIASPTRRS